jgi:hypothetical protein
MAISMRTVLGGSRFFCSQLRRLLMLKEAEALADDWTEDRR